MQKKNQEKNSTTTQKLKKNTNKEKKDNLPLASVTSLSNIDDEITMVCVVESCGQILNW
jgi:hypothetical protein